MPFKREDGSVVPYTFLHCECNPDYGPDVREHYQAVTPDMYDFPMSSDFRAFSYNYCGIPDPGAVTASREVVREVVVERQPANMVPLRAELKHYQNKLNEHIDAAKKAAEARRPTKKPTGYKGLEIKD